MDSQTYRLGFIGAGKLAGSIIRGLIRANFCSPGEIIASEPGEQTRIALERETSVNTTTDNKAVVENAETIFIGVKPGVVLTVLRELRGNLEDKLIISLAAGVKLESLKSAGNARFLRALTNTPSAICRGATAIARGERTTNDDINRVRQIFSAVGIVVEIPEAQIDAVTALSGSGPAFVYTVIEAMAQGGSKMGLSEKVALDLAAQTVRGAAELMLESKLPPETLRKMVVTPGGTTAAGLAEMERLRTKDGLIAAIEAATKRGQEMTQENL